MAPISQNNGVVTPKTDKQANRLVERRRKVKERQRKLQERKESGKKTLLGNVRRKRLEKKRKRIQQKINVNPTALKWKGDKDASFKEASGSGGGALERYQKEKSSSTTKDIVTDPITYIKKGTRKKKKLGGFRNMEATWIEPGTASLDD